ncbi:MAG: cysteine desulfurase, partial [Ignavibacteria bacterium]|nr:cysteine desulfurase [Ignavibacteria bacterium]
RENSNIHRGVHYLSETATRHYEDVREKVRSFINAQHVREIVFVRGTTEGINLLANSFGRDRIRKGSEVVITAIEHHSNIVPWQMLCQDQGAHLRVVPVNDNGEVDFAEYERAVSSRPAMVAVTHVSNALGTINPVRRMVDVAHTFDVPVIIDGAQAVPHMRVDVQEIGCDFYAFSSHKMYGPTGIGVLYGKSSLLEHMRPYQGGGDMIKSVSFEHTVYNDIPYRFEAGTPNIAGTIGLGAAIDYLTDIGLETIEAHESRLLSYATTALSTVPGLTIIGTAADKAAVISFVLDGVHPHDIGTIVDAEGIAIRTGHHCAQPVMKRFGVPATARASFGLYNTTGEIDLLVRALHKVIEVMN